MPRNFKSVTPLFFKFEKEGDSIEGFLVDVQDFNYRNGDAAIRYIIRTEDGVDYSFNGTAVINQRMALVTNGEYIKVEMTGTLDTGNVQPAKMFEVYRDAGESSS